MTDVERCGVYSNDVNCIENDVDQNEMGYIYKEFAVENEGTMFSETCTQEQPLSTSLLCKWDAA